MNVKITVDRKRRCRDRAGKRGVLVLFRPSTRLPENHTPLEISLYSAENNSNMLTRRLFVLAVQGRVCTKSKTC